MEATLGSDKFGSSLFPGLLFYGRQVSRCRVVILHRRSTMSRCNRGQRVLPLPRSQLRWNGGSSRPMGFLEHSARQRRLDAQGELQRVPEQIAKATFSPGSGCGRAVHGSIPGRGLDYTCFARWTLRLALDRIWTRTASVHTRPLSGLRCATCRSLFSESIERRSVWLDLQCRETDRRASMEAILLRRLPRLCGRLHGQI